AGILMNNLIATGVQALATGAVTLKSTGDITTDGPVGGSSVTITSSGKTSDLVIGDDVTATNGSIAITGADLITLAPNISVTATATSKPAVANVAIKDTNLLGTITIGASDQINTLSSTGKPGNISISIGPAGSLAGSAPPFVTYQVGGSNF